MHSNNTDTSLQQSETYRGIELSITSTTEKRVTVEEITFELDGKPHRFFAAYGLARIDARRTIDRHFGSEVQLEVAPERFGGEVPAGVDW